MFSHMASYFFSVRHFHLAYSASGWWLTRIFLVWSPQVCLLPGSILANQHFIKPTWVNSTVYKIIMPQHICAPECRWQRRPAEGIRSPGAGVVGDCEPLPAEHAGDWTQVLCKRTICALNSWAIFPSAVAFCFDYACDKSAFIHCTHPSPWCIWF